MTLGSDEILTALRVFGLGFPGAHGKSPWPDHDDLAIKDRIFAYLPKAGSAFSLGFKLPYTGAAVLDLPFAAPTA